ncbi:hypothetical protein GJ496_008191 [Pomphorhynchus laevis]|nr:hypothetical protein GJ496_008191 [Pomphorhynchus laevis]
MTRNSSYVDTQFRKLKLETVDTSDCNDNCQVSCEYGEAQLEFSRQRVEELLSCRNSQEALVYVLKNAMFSEKFNSGIKRRYTAIVLRVLSSFRATTIEKTIDDVVNQNSMVLIDNLMKYIYACFELCTKESSILHVWHEKAFAIGGHGSIIRVLTDHEKAL